MNIFCACGCGEQLKPNKRGKIKARYINGHWIRIHNPRKGKSYTEEESQILSNLLKGKTAWNKGIPHTKEHIQKIIDSSPHLSKENHPNWKGGITPLNQSIRNSPEMLEWKAQVRGRDNWTCQKCGCKGWMEAHHKKELSIILKEYNIKNVEEAIQCNELWDINNGITLCKECHNKTKRGKFIYNGC